MLLLGAAATIATGRLSAAPPPGKDAGQIGDYQLADTHGTMHTPAEWRQAKAVVLLFLGTECPVSNGYAPDMEALAERYAPRGVAVYGVHSVPGVTADQAAAHAKDYGLTFTILLDPEQRLARMAGARVTPDAIVATSEGRVAYRGRIDDRYSLDGKRRDEPRTHELDDAIRAVAAGKSPRVRETKAYGCPLPGLRSTRR